MTKMSHARYRAALADIGLSDNEAAVYLAALALGPASATEIARHAGLKRTSVYPLIDTLRTKGAMVVDLSGLKRRFTAVEPAALRGLMAQRFERFEAMIPNLAALKSGGEREDVVRLYRGITAIKSLYEELLGSVRRGDEYLVMTDFEAWLDLDRPFFEGFVRRRGKIVLDLRLVLAGSDGRPPAVPAAKIRYLPKGMPLRVNFVLTPKMVVFHQLTRPFTAVRIDNPDVIALQRQLFEVTWHSLRAHVIGTK